MGKANLEIKARCGNLESMRAAAMACATHYVGLDHQVDTYFVTPHGRLKLRESSLSGGQLVPYLRPDGHGPRRSDYQVIPLEDPAALKELLTGILGVHRVVRKEREIWLHENVRIHLDRVHELGEFCELEAVFDGTGDAEPEQQRKVEYLMGQLGIRETDLVPTSYETLLGVAGPGAC